MDFEKYKESVTQNVDTRKAKDQVRFEALRDVKEICKQWQAMPREALFGEVVELVQELVHSTFQPVHR